MKFTAEQERALKAVNDWYHNSDKQVFHLFGYAGTGKTTLAKYIAESIGDEDVLFGAYTGKAAHVLKSKGCLNASTIHSLIYRSRDKSKTHLQTLEQELSDLLIELKDEDPELIETHPKVKKLRREINDEIDNINQPNFILNHESIVRDASLVCIDECSMVDSQMGADLLSFGTPVLVLGDPAQLPPIGSGGYFTENITPDFMLEEIHRQAAESPILRMATKVRNNEPLELGDWGNNCFVHPHGTRLNPDLVLDYDQILVGKNVTRYAINCRIRELLNHEGEYPVIGDRLVCLKNDSDIGILNGAIFDVIEIDGIMDQKVHMSVRPEGSQLSVNVQSLEHHFLGKGKELQKQYWLRGEAHEFDYGYALTVHKSQGSQWENVLIFDESNIFRKDRNRWLYTAITRASETVSVVRM